MSPLRRRMIDDMQIRNLTSHTQRVYVAQIVRFACHFRKSPELLGPDGRPASGNEHLGSGDFGFDLFPRRAECFARG